MATATGRATPNLLDGSGYPYRHEITTRFADIDPNLHINNVAMVAAFEDARARFDFSLGLRKMLGTRRVMIAANYIEYVGQAFYPDPLVMFVGAVDFGRSSWTLACLATQDGRACAFARSVLVCTEGDRPTPIPDEFRAALETQRLRRSD